METEEGETMARLVESLRPAVRGRPRVRLLLCFLGDEDSQASLGRTVTLSDLQDPKFRFRNLEVLTVVRGAVEQRDAADEVRAGNGGRGPRS